VKTEILQQHSALIRRISLWIFSAFFVLAAAKLISVSVAGVKAEGLISRATEKGIFDANDLENVIKVVKKKADALKENNLFIEKPPRKNPVSEVMGILGSEALINGKWYKAGDKVGDANILAIEPTRVKVEWDGKIKMFAPLSDAKVSPRTAMTKASKERPRRENRTRPDSQRRGRFGRGGRGGDRPDFSSMSEEEISQWREQRRSRRTELRDRSREATRRRNDSRRQRQNNGN
jgi:hypothetical protein